jgi:uncharacterized membrane protein YfcA
MLAVILSLLVVMALYFAVFFVKDYIKAAKNGLIEKTNFLLLGCIGFVVNFLDTLGIGSFAITTAALKNFKLTSDKKIPGTLNVSCTIPIVIQALVFITVIKVDTVTLVSMIAAAVLGSILGVGIVAKLDEKKIQIGMGIALMVVAFIMTAGQLGLFPVGGEAVGLTGAKLIIAIVCNFVLGALMTLGIGLYAPCMALVFALGLSPAAAFPIMMGSCAFLMPVASTRFVKEEAHDRKASMAIATFGSVGVLIAAFIVKSLPLDMLKWTVIVVVLFTSVMMFKSATKKSKGLGFNS